MSNLVRQTDPQIVGSKSSGLENGWIETMHGRFDLKNPKFDINDIAHALSQIARFNGHTKRFYSVAEHSLMVADLMEGLGLGDPREGLLHDATEAYLSDVPAPFKQFLPDWQKVDVDLEAALRAQYGLPERKTEGCRKADWLALFIEAYHLLPSEGAIFHDPNNLRPEALRLIENGWIPRTHRTMQETEDDFLLNYRGIFELRRS
jgi:hypothetical protein